MRCSQAQRLVNDHIDSRLNREQIQGLERHLETCGSCRRLLGDLTSIVDGAKQMEAVVPSSDLWSRIEAHATERPGSTAVRSARRNRFSDFFPVQRSLALAMSTVLVVVVLAGLLYRGPSLLENMGLSIGGRDRQEIAAAHLREAEHHYKLAIAELSGAISKQSDMDPALATVFKENLEIIDHSIQLCRNAVDRYPESLDAELYLMASYRQKIELLNEIKRITTRHV
jgi:hypothetical protein